MLLFHLLRDSLPEQLSMVSEERERGGSTRFIAVAYVASGSTNVHVHTPHQSMSVLSLTVRSEPGRLPTVFHISPHSEYTAVPTPQGGCRQREIPISAQYTIFIQTTVLH